MTFRTLVIGFFSLLIVAIAGVTYSGDCIRQLFSASAEVLADDRTAPVASTPVRENPAPPSETGQLTAGAWDDNLNYDYFLAFRQRFQTGTPASALPDRLQVQHR